VFSTSNHCSLTSSPIAATTIFSSLPLTSGLEPFSPLPWLLHLVTSTRQCNSRSSPPTLTSSDGFARGIPNVTLQTNLSLVEISRLDRKETLVGCQQTMMTLNLRVQAIEDPSSPLEMPPARVSLEIGGVEVEPICPQDNHSAPRFQFFSRRGWRGHSTHTNKFVRATLATSRAFSQSSVRALFRTTFASDRKSEDDSTLTATVIIPSTNL
jgi:hypothetical protein